MIQDEKILITGPAGKIAFGLAQTLAPHNEVWGIARFADPAQRAEVEALGVTTRAVDLGDPDLAEVPRDFSYVLHIAADFGEDYDQGLRVNAEGTGLLLSHCRNAKAALVMSTVTVYKPHPDPWHPFTETDPLGDAGLPSPLPYSITKIGQEAVARYCAREFGLPVTIGRMGSAYGDRGGLPGWHLHAIAAGQPVTLRHDPLPYSPIHDDDIAAHLPALLDAATTPAHIVNYCGDRAVTAQDWCAYLGELLGVEAKIDIQAVPGASVGSVGDPTKRIALTGPSRVDWRDGLRRMAKTFYPDRIEA